MHPLFFNYVCEVFIRLVIWSQIKWQGIRWWCHIIVLDKWYLRLDNNISSNVKHENMNVFMLYNIFRKTQLLPSKWNAFYNIYSISIFNEYLCLMCNRSENSDIILPLNILQNCGYEFTFASNFMIKSNFDIFTLVTEFIGLLENTDLMHQAISFYDHSHSKIPHNKPTNYLVSD